MPPRKPPSPPVWNAEHMRIANDAAGVALWSWDVDTDHIALDARAHALWGVPLHEHVTFEDLSAHIHPQDLDRVRAAFEATRTVRGAYEIDFRIVVGEELRWISARGQGSYHGIVGHVMFGIFLDVTGRKQAEESNELLAGEMSHRVKNLLHVASALTAITSRSAKTTESMAHDLTTRLMALGRAHDLVRPVRGQKQRAALLSDLIAVLLAPYDDMGDFSGRVRVSVPTMAVGEASATTLAMIVHELATNSLKYGALSAAGGTLDISCTDHGDDDLVVAWVERGGQPVARPTGFVGFGSKLVERGVSGQLAGSVEYDWSEGGVVVTLRMNKTRLKK